MADFRVTIEIKDVGKGDVLMLVDEIMATHGDNFDAARGDFTISATKKVGENQFYVDLDSEDDD